jgi:predicted dithiol-disulfide oxidoreductase (DUF899 family)
MTLPETVDRATWLESRKELLAKEKELTRQRDRVNADRRRLPMVKVEKEYEFTGPDGPVSLADMFEGRPQLIVGHFMFDPRWDEACTSCSARADEVSDALLRHLAVRDTTLCFISRAPIEKLERVKAEKGWSFAWYSSYGSDFNYDYEVTIDDSVRPAAYNYRDRAEWAATADGADWLDEDQPIEMSGTSAFLRTDDGVFHTYSSYGRAFESVGGAYYWLDLTALGRQEDWEEPKGRSADVRVDRQPNFAS